MLTKLWRILFDFATTTLGAAIISGLVFFSYGTLRAERKVNAAWGLKVAQAAVEAEKARLRRDAIIKAEIEVSVAGRVKRLEIEAADLNDKVTKYEQVLSQRGVNAACVLDSNDERSLQYRNPNGGSGSKPPRRLRIPLHSGSRAAG
jgi:hypothetical protein